jgi:purine-binding chemotaxis protein CheW
VKTDDVRLVTFRLGDALFAADIFSVERVVRHTVPSHVPNVPSWIEGVIGHRGKVIPVVDLRRRIELTHFSITADTRILVLVTTDGLVGAIVDSVVEVATIPLGAVAPPPPLFRGIDSHYLRGIATIRGQLVVILEMERMLTSADRLVFEQAVEAAQSATAGRG